MREVFPDGRPTGEAVPPIAVQDHCYMSYKVHEHDLGNQNKMSDNQCPMIERALYGSSKYWTSSCVNVISVPSAKKIEIGLNTQYIVVARTYKLFQVLEACRTDHRCSDTRQRPRQGDLRHAYSALLGDRFHPIGALIRPESYSFTGKNGPADNLRGTRSLKVRSGVQVTTNRVR